MSDVEGLPPGWIKKIKVRSFDRSKKDPVWNIIFLLLNEKLHFVYFHRWDSDSSNYVCWSTIWNTYLTWFEWSLLLQFYIDPVNGYVFRSKKDVMRYLKTGDINQCAYRPKKMRSNDQDLTSDEKEVAVSLYFLFYYAQQFPFVTFT